MISLVDTLVNVSTSNCAIVRVDGLPPQHWTGIAACLANVMQKQWPLFSLSFQVVNDMASYL